jgi:murein DD-endopeptidase MepM/ murein hydrolase activator NlpD
MVVALSGFSAVAFGIAPLAPDASELPQQWVTEPIALSSLDEQLEALAVHPMALVRGDVTRDSDTAETLLARLGAVDPSAALFLRSDPIARMVLRGRGGKMVQARTGSEGELVELTARYPSERQEFAGTHFIRLTMSRVDGVWQARSELVPLSSAVRLASGTIRSTLFAATDEAGIPDVIASQLADVFSTDIDFHRELRQGDSFSVVYEALTADGEPVTWNAGTGRVLAAEFVNAGRAHHAIWFDGASGRGGYFDIHGVSKRRAFLSSPMEFSRVTSGFAMRFHPILQSWRRHLGVDYAAPVGTPVRAIGEGVVDFAGWQNGYGQVVQIQHGKDRSTLYAHLSRIDVRKGQRVAQGDHVGAVGMTGWTTGPHLHFEFHVNGQHRDPLIMAKSADTVALDEAARPRFAEFARTYQAKLDIAESLVGARSRFE